VAYLIDSDVLIGAYRRDTRSRHWLRAHVDEGQAVSLISAGEMYEGAEHASNPQLELHAIREFLSSFAPVGLDDEVMQRFARERASLRRQGRMIADLNLLIAATALVNNLTLVTRNTRHFERIPGLEIQVLDERRPPPGSDE